MINDVLAEWVKEYAEQGGAAPELMSSKCSGGGGGTQSAAPGCADISDHDQVAGSTPSDGDSNVA